MPEALIFKPSNPYKSKLLTCIACLKIQNPLSAGFVCKWLGGERGIRTPGPVARTTVFKTAAIDHSAISPSASVTLEGSGSSGCKYNLFLLFCPGDKNLTGMLTWHHPLTPRKWAPDTITEPLFTILRGVINKKSAHFS